MILQLSMTFHANLINANMKKILFLATLIVAGLLLSCSNDNDELQQTETTSESEVVEYLNITYHGNEFLHVPTFYDEKGDFVFLDAEFSKIYEDKLANNINWSIKMKSSSDIEFYDNLDENLKMNGIKMSNAIPLRSMSDTIVTNRSTSYEYLAYLTLYDDKDFKDTN